MGKTTTKTDAEAPAEPEATCATGEPDIVVPSAPTNPFNFHCLSFFNYKEWGKTTTKTDEVVPEAGREPEAIRATGVPVIVVPSAPTNSFKFHCLSFFNYKEWEKT